MKANFLLLNILLLVFSTEIHAQKADKYLNTRGWKGSFSFSVEDKDSITGITTIVKAKGPAVLMNTNPKTPLSMIWPMVSANQLQINTGSSVEEQLNAGQSIQNAYLQWDATISYQRLEKKDDFPVDTRDFSCSFEGKKKSMLSISFITDEKKESWFHIKGMVSVRSEEVNCSGSMDGQPLNSRNDLPDPSVLNYSAEATDKRKLSVSPGPRFHGESNYTEDNKKIHVEFDFSPVL